MLVAKYDIPLPNNGDEQNDWYNIQFVEGEH